MIQKEHPRFFFTHDEMDQITEAIRSVEKQTTGQIHFYLEWRCPLTDPLSRSIQLFHKLNLHRSPDRNTVFLYFCTKYRLFAFLADQGLNEKISYDFWVGLKEIMEIRFKNGQYLSGALMAVEQIGNRLVQFYPKS